MDIEVERPGAADQVFCYEDVDRIQVDREAVEQTVNFEADLGAVGLAKEWSSHIRGWSWPRDEGT